MAHELDFSRGFAAIATGAGTPMPWHNHVNDYILPGDSVDEICRKAGIDFQVLKAPIVYNAVTANGDSPMNFDNRCVMYRNDTGAALSVMSESHYVPAQPADLVNGLLEVVKGSGFVIDCVMALKGGKVISALARRECEPGQLGEDIQMPYLGLLTSFDGTYARQGNLTTIRRVCMNTVRWSLQGNNSHTVKQRNSKEFTLESANDLFDKLGEFDAAFAEYMEIARAMSKVKMTDNMRERFFSKLYAPDAFDNADLWQKGKFDLNRFDDKKQKPMISTNAKNVVADLMDCAASSPGAELPAAKGTLWGAFNAITFYQDHAARTKGDKRWESASIGAGAVKKEEALDLARSVLA